MTLNKIKLLVFLVNLVFVTSSSRITPLQGAFVVVQQKNPRLKSKESLPNKQDFLGVPPFASIVEDVHRHLRHLQLPKPQHESPKVPRFPQVQGRPSRHVPIVAQMGVFVQPSGNNPPQKTHSPLSPGFLHDHHFSGFEQHPELSLHHPKENFKKSISQPFLSPPAQLIIPKWNPILPPVTNDETVHEFGSLKHADPHFHHEPENLSNPYYDLNLAEDKGNLESIVQVERSVLQNNSKQEHFEDSFTKKNFSLEAQPIEVKIIVEQLESENLVRNKISSPPKFSTIEPTAIDLIPQPPNPIYQGLEQPDLMSLEPNRIDSLFQNATITKDIVDEVDQSLQFDVNIIGDEKSEIDEDLEPTVETTINFDNNFTRNSTLKTSQPSSATEEEVFEREKISPKRQTKQKILIGSFEQYPTIQPFIFQGNHLLELPNNVASKKKVYKSRINVYPNTFYPPVVPIFDLAPDAFLLESPFEAESSLNPDFSVHLQEDDESFNSLVPLNQTPEEKSEFLANHTDNFPEKDPSKVLEDPFEITTSTAIPTTTTPRKFIITTLRPSPKPTKAHTFTTFRPPNFPTKSWSYINFNPSKNSSVVVNTLIDHQATQKSTKGIFTQSHSEKGVKPTPPPPHSTPSTKIPKKKFFIYKHQVTRPIGNQEVSTTNKPSLIILNPSWDNFVLNSTERENITNADEGSKDSLSVYFQSKPPVVDKNSKEVKNHEVGWIPLVSPDLVTVKPDVILTDLPEHQSTLPTPHKQSDLGLRRGTSTTKKPSRLIKSNPTAKGNSIYKDSDFPLRAAYNFNYRVTPVPDSQYKHEEFVDDSGNRSGEYGLRDGQSTIKVKYVVGSKTGFQADSAYSFSSPKI